VSRLREARPERSEGASGLTYTGGAVENQVVPDTDYPMLPRQEQLVRLYALRDDIERAIGRRGVSNPRSEAERHAATHGHLLRHGCCRKASESR